MSFRKSFGKYKQSVIEAESTWQIDCKKRKLLHNTFLFITTSNIMETMYYDDEGDNCECVIIGSSVKSIPEGTFFSFSKPTYRHFPVFIITTKHWKSCFL